MTGATIWRQRVSGRSRSRAIPRGPIARGRRRSGLEVPLLSDWNGEAIRAFDVAFEPLGMNDVAIRSAFLIRDGKSIEAAWLLGADLPDIDAVLEAARV